MSSLALADNAGSLVLEKVVTVETIQKLPIDRLQILTKALEIRGFDKVDLYRDRVELRRQIVEALERRLADPRVSAQVEQVAGNILGLSLKASDLKRSAVRDSGSGEIARVGSFVGPLNTARGHADSLINQNDIFVREGRITQEVADRYERIVRDTGNAHRIGTGRETGCGQLPSPELNVEINVEMAAMEAAPSKAASAVEKVLVDETRVTPEQAKINRCILAKSCNHIAAEAAAGCN